MAGLICMKFSVKKYGMTMGRHDSILAQFGETARCAAMLISLSAFVNITCKRLD